MNDTEHPMIEQFRQIARINAYQEKAKLGTLEEQRKKEALEQEQRFQAAEATVEYHENGSPRCPAERVGTAEMDRPLFRRYFRMYPNSQQPEDNALMRAARLTLARAQELAQIPPRFTLAFVGEQIPAGFVPRARVNGGVYEDHTTNLTTTPACSLNSDQEEIVVPMDSPVNGVCVTIIALVLYHARSRRQPMPPFKASRQFGDPLIPYEAAEYKRDWLAELRRQADTDAVKVWREIGADVLKEAGL